MLHENVPVMTGRLQRSRETEYSSTRKKSDKTGAKGSSKVFFLKVSVKFRLSGAFFADFFQMFFWVVDFDLIFSNILVCICTFLCQRAGHKILEDWSESFVVNEADATMMYNYLYSAVAERHHLPTTSKWDKVITMITFQFFSFEWCFVTDFD